VSSEPQPTQTTVQAWPILDALERRVLGVLVEKAKTTPDAYPLSLNALVTGCNQKSNRDPLLNVGEDEVEDALGRCQKKGLAVKITGGRVERWRHVLYEAWRVDKLDLAVLAELLLRGPQTEGELRTRASRMEPIDDLDALRAVLKPLAERKLVVYLTPEERRGTVLTHGFHAPQELAHLRGQASAEIARPPAAPTLASSLPVAVVSHADEKWPAVEAALAEARAELDGLKKTVADLGAEMAKLREDLNGLRQALGA